MTFLSLKKRQARATGKASSSSSPVAPAPANLTRVSVTCVRPGNIGAHLKTPTVIMIRKALDLTEADYEKIRDLVTTAIQDSEVLRTFDLDVNRSSQQERDIFCNAISDALAPQLAQDPELFKKLVDTHRAISPWLLYKFVLLRRKRMKVGGKSDENEVSRDDSSVYELDIDNTNTASPTPAGTIKLANPFQPNEGGKSKDGLKTVSNKKAGGRSKILTGDNASDLSIAHPPAKKAKEGSGYSTSSDEELQNAAAQPGNLEAKSEALFRRQIEEIGKAKLDGTVDETLDEEGPWDKIILLFAWFAVVSALALGIYSTQFL
ncbi:hypothetical protein H072_2421 [Dactylellina haptotyla CBS 200.50]|uniref:Uncharacterized protein n=1 Tax=Dactylellina haptotyla (strain CBS 200.50) TaxID=1284197 RepID=S8AL60_DACHA|nr:hypothetical protein H072_2421 [Dactylellina haptotyla CBS 200.50]